MRNANFVTLLESLKELDNKEIMESIIEAYDLIYESSEDVVNSIKTQLGTEEENPLDQVNPEIEPESEFPEEPDPNDIPVDDSI